MEAMLDCETLGIIPGSAIISIGAVCFDNTKVYTDKNFYMKTRPGPDDRIDFDTVVNFWFKQSDKARGEFTKNDSKDMSFALQELSRFLNHENNVDFVWSNGSSFDLVLLESLYRRYSVPIPWAYNAHQDCRTLYRIAGVKPKKDEESHNALVDAIRQAETAVQAYQIIEDWKNLNADDLELTPEELQALKPAMQFLSPKVRSMLTGEFP